MLMPKELIESVLNNTGDLITIENELNLDLTKTRSEIDKIVAENAEEFQHQIGETQNYHTQIASIHTQIERLKIELDQKASLLHNVSEIDQCKVFIQGIEALNSHILIIQSLQQFDLALVDFKSAIDSRDYAKCNEYLVKLNEISSGADLFRSTTEIEPEIEHMDSRKMSLADKVGLHDTYHEIMIVKELKEEFVVQRERLWYELDQEWDNMCKIEVLSDANCRFMVRKTITQQSVTDLTQFSPLLNSSKLSSSFIFSSKLKQLSKRFLQMCQMYILTTEENEFDIHISGNAAEDFQHLEFRSVPSKTRNQQELLEFKLDLIHQILSFLYSNFFKFEIKQNIETAATPTPKTKNSTKSVKPLLIRPKTLMSLFSEVVLTDFVQLIYEQLIIRIIPLRDFDCQLEAQICEKVAVFERNLQDIDFLTKSSKVFGAFVSNVEELYVRKKCKHVLNESRELMKRKDLIFETHALNECQDYFKKENLDNSSFCHQEMMKNKLLELDLNRRRNSSASTWHIDDTNLLHISESERCCISQMSKQCVALIYETLNETLHTVENVQNMRHVSLLCLVIKNIFDMYASVVPTFHRDTLRDIPLLSAIVYNDFMYLAHVCLSISHQYRHLFETMREKRDKSVEKVVLDDLMDNFSCMESVPKFCSIANEILNQQLNAQQTILMQYLFEDNNGIKDLAEHSNYDQYKRSLQKCIFQLNKLSSIWLPVMSTRVYLRSFGQFFHLICTNLIKSCLQLEDISSDDASYIYASFALVKQCVLDIFAQKSGSNEESNAMNNLTFSSSVADLNAAKHVASWSKFKYLLVILKSNLQEIVELWTAGKGPLAIYFDSEEVRNLIRALFMITDRRSAALEKIKY